MKKRVLKKRILATAITLLTVFTVLMPNYTPANAAVDTGLPLHTHTHNGELKTHTDGRLYATESGGCYTSKEEIGSHTEGSDEWYQCIADSSHTMGAGWGREHSYCSVCGAPIEPRGGKTTVKDYGYFLSCTKEESAGIVIPFNGSSSYATYTHAHQGTESAGGACYTPIYHTHTGSPTTGGGCYTVLLKKDVFNGTELGSGVSTTTEGTQYWNEGWGTGTESSSKSPSLTINTRGLCYSHETKARPSYSGNQYQSESALKAYVVGTGKITFDMTNFESITVKGGGRRWGYSPHSAWENCYLKLGIDFTDEKEPNLHNGGYWEAVDYDLTSFEYTFDVSSLTGEHSITFSNQYYAGGDYYPNGAELAITSIVAHNGGSEATEVYGLGCGKTEGVDIDSYTFSCPIDAATPVVKIYGKSNNKNKVTMVEEGKNANTTVSYTWTKPDGSTATGSSLTCDQVGQYIIQATAKTKVNETETENDTATFVYNAAPANTDVTFYDYDGTTVIATANTYAGAEPTTIAIPVRTGYTFTGYYTAATGGTKTYDETGHLVTPGYCAITGGDISFYAQYTANKYKVTYDTDKEGGTKTDEMTYDQNATLSTDAKAYSGYTFFGWFADLADENPLFNTARKYVNTKWDKTGDITVKAKYIANEYNLNYSLNKEEETSAHTKKVTFDAAYELPATDIAARTPYTGYTFLGWYDGSDQIFDADGNPTSSVWHWTKDINAKATYEAKSYTITYYVENPDEETVTNKTQLVHYDDTGVTLETASKSYPGWTLGGYYNGSTKVFNADGTFVKDSWDIDGDITVTPKWIPKNYTLNFSLDKEEDVTANTRQIPFNSVYGLTEAEKASRKSYKGYTFNGWYDGETLIFDADGNNTDTGKWRFLRTVNAKATYTPNPYTVYYNTKESDAPSKTLGVVFDSDYRLPEGDVNEVPTISGYTFDGWFDADGNKVFNVNGTPVNTPYDYDHDITVYVTYHKNKYTVHYNNGTISDEPLDQSVVVTFDESYIDITQAPYKKGYVFDGHSIKGTNTFIWDGKGNKTHAIWDFVCGVDGAEIDAVKNYHPKEFTVSVGADFDDDGAIDSVKKTETATYDAAYFDLEVPAAIDGYTFDGYYLLENNVWVAKYDTGTGKLTKESDTWVYDDNLNWVNDTYTGKFTVVEKWHANKYTLRYNYSDVSDSNLNLTKTVTFNQPYDTIGYAPYKEGYVYDGLRINNTWNPNTYIYDAKGNPTHEKWDFVCGEDGAEVRAFKIYHAKTFTLEVGRDYDEDKKMDSVLFTQDATFDDAYSFTVPDPINGLTFKGYYLFNTDTCLAEYNTSNKTLTPTKTKWAWDDGKDWVKTGDTKTTIQVDQRFVRNKITVFVQTANDKKLDDGSYNYITEQKVFEYDRKYDNITPPVKKGYDFQGYQFTTGTFKDQYVWDKDGKATKDTWTFYDDYQTVKAIFTPKSYTLKYPGGNSIKVTYDAATETIKTDSKTGHTFKGYKLPEANGGAKVFGSDGKPVSKLWDNDLGANGTEVTLESIFDVNYYNIIADYGGEFPSQTIGVGYGSQYGNLTIPVKKGYKLLGFVDKATVIPKDVTTLDAASYMFDAAGVGGKYYNTAGDTTVVPVWKAETYTINLGGTGKSITVTYDDATPSFGGTAPSKEYCDFLGWYYGNGVLFRTDGSPAINIWNIDLGDDGAVISLPARFTDPVYPVEDDKDDTEDTSEEDTSEEVTSEEPTSEPVETSEVIEKEDEPIKGTNKVLDILKTAAPYVGITAGVIIFFGAAAAMVLMILFVLGRIAMLYKVPLNGKPKFAQPVFVETMRNYERTGLTKFRVKMPKKYFGIMSSNLDSTTLQIKLSKPFVVKNVGQKVIIGYNNLAAEYEVSEIIEV